MFDNLFEQAEILFRNGNIDIVNAVFECAKISARKYTHNVTQRCKEFFVKTKTIVSIFKKLLDLYVKSDDYNVLFLLEDFTIPELIAFSNVAVLKVGKITVALSGREGDYKYVISSRTTDLRAKAKDINLALRGRGGGRPEMIQGSFSATIEEIKDYFK